MKKLKEKYVFIEFIKGLYFVAEDFLEENENLFFITQYLHFQLSLCMHMKLKVRQGFLNFDLNVT